MLKRVICASAFSASLALSLYGAGCSSSSGGGTGGDSGAKQDTGIIHHPDTGANTDTGVNFPETGGKDGNGGMCSPPSTVTFTPTLHPAPAAGMCTPKMIDDIIAACFNPDTAATATCQSLIKGSSAYLACVQGCMETGITPSSVTQASSAWGGILGLTDQGGLGFYNLGGCVAALDTSAAGQTCATDIQAEVECFTEACQSCMVGSTPTDAEIADFSACQSAAAPTSGTGPCTAAISKVQTDCMAETSDASPGLACFEALGVLEATSPKPTSEQYTLAFQILFGSVCAPAIFDGGLGDGGGGGG